MSPTDRAAYEAEVAQDAAEGRAAVARAPAAPMPTDVPEALRMGLKTYLRDPGSAQFEITRGPRFGDFQSRGRDLSGWLVCGLMNGKNAYGAYIGFKGYLFVIDDRTGKATAIPEIGPYGDADDVRQECRLAADAAS